MKDEPEIPNCRNCRYFYITWDAKKPYGCRAMQFKSSVLPTIEVLEADGAVCISFRKKGNSFDLDAAKYFELLDCGIDAL